MCEVRPERTGWRDEELSARHRTWGWDCPAVDIDFLLLEYDRGRVAALVEYKHERAALPNPEHPSYRALIDLGDRARVPVFVTRYATGFSWWRVTPLNEQARRWLHKATTMTEREWVSLLYRIRGRKLPPDIFQGEQEA